MANYDSVSDLPRHILATMTDSNGKAAWQTISLNTLESNSTSLELVSPLDGNTSSSPSGNFHIGRWLTVYARIKQYTQQ